MNLKSKSLSPERALTWNGRSLAVCSHKELIECVIHLARQIAILEGKLKEKPDAAAPAHDPDAWIKKVAMADKLPAPAKPRRKPAKRV